MLIENTNSKLFSIFSDFVLSIGVQELVIEGGTAVLVSVNKGQGLPHAGHSKQFQQRCWWCLRETYLRKSKMFHGRTCERKEWEKNKRVTNHPTDTKVSKEGGKEVFQVPELRYSCSPWRGWREAGCPSAAHGGWWWSRYPHRSLWRIPCCGRWIFHEGRCSSVERPHQSRLLDRATAVGKELMQEQRVWVTERNCHELTITPILHPPCAAQDGARSESYGGRSDVKRDNKGWREFFFVSHHPYLF